jgi:hypothetical protein
MIYITKNGETIFFINLKGGYCSFEHLVQTKKLYKLNYGFNDYKIDPTVLKRVKKNAKAYLLMRCPYTKLCTFYVDKFVNLFNNPDKSVYYDKNKNFQTCQLTMFKYFDKDKIINNEFTFLDFFNAMRNGYTDGHIRPQIIITQNNILDMDINILTYESHSFNRIMKKLLGFKHVHKHRTYFLNYYKMLTAKNKRFIYNLYKQDFLLYSKKIIKFNENLFFDKNTINHIDKCLVCKKHHKRHQNKKKTKTSNTKKNTNKKTKKKH